MTIADRPARNYNSATHTSASAEEVMTRQALELAEELQRQFNDRNALYRDVDNTIFSNYAVEIPDAYRKTALEVRAPLALHIATTVTAALSVNQPGVGFKPIGFGDVYQQNSTLRETFFEASWARQEDEAHRDLFRLFMWSLACKGEGIMKTVERCQSAWSEYDSQAAELKAALEHDEEFREYDQHARDLHYDHATEAMKLRLPYPIASTDVPPETFYYSKNENGFTACVEIKNLPYVEALERFGAGLDSNGRVVDPIQMAQLDPRALQLARAEWQDVMRSAGTGMVQCIEAWDSNVQVILLRGPGQRPLRTGDGRGATLCRVVHHDYGEPITKTLKGPYFHALGVTTDSRLPEHAGLGILFGYLPLFRLMDSLLTTQANAAFLTGFPAFKKITPPNQIAGLEAPYGRDGRETSPTTIEPGKLYPYDVMPIDQPKNGVETDKLMQNIQQMLEAALPSTLQGMLGADQSGYALNQAAYLARIAWDPIVKGAQRALAQRVGFESWLIEHQIGEAVYAWGEQYQKGSNQTTGTASKGTWLKLGPDDLKGVHRYTVSLNPSTPSNDIVETRALGEKMQLKLITYEDAVEAAGSNPDEVEKSWMLYDMKRSPEMQQALKDAVFQKVATIRTKALDQLGLSPQELAGGPGLGGPGAGPAGPPPAAIQAMGGPMTPGAPPPGGPGGMPANPVPPQPGLPQPAGPIPGMGGVPGLPATNIPLPGQAP